MKKSFYTPVAIGLLLLVGVHSVVVLADTPYAGSYLRLTGGTVTGEVSLNEGFEAIEDFDTVCSSASARYDYDGVQACGPLADALPAAMRVNAQASAPLATGANQTGANIELRPGTGTKRAAMTAASWVNNTTTFTVTVDGTALTGTEGTAFECDSVSNAVCADNVANYYETLAGAAGVHACSSGSTTTCTTFGFTGVAGTAYFWPAPEDSPAKLIDSIAISTGAGAALVNGTNGSVTVPFGTAAVPSGAFTGDADTGYYRSAANTFGIAVGGASGLTVTGTAVSVVGTTLNIGGTRQYIDSSSGFTCTASSAPCWVYQNQDAVGDSRVIGSADTGTEVGATVGTKYADAAITGTTVRLLRGATDADGTPVEKFWFSNAGDLTLDAQKAQDSVNTITLDAATTIAITKNVHILDCVGAETLTTITGGLAGSMLTIIFFDADVCTVTDDATCTANTINISAAYLSSADDTLTLISDGTCWREVSRSVN